MLRPIWIDDGSPIPDPFGYGERAVQWLRRRKHPKNPAPGSPFTLDPWQEQIVRRIYGPRDEDGRRIVREVFLGLPRGNRKTSLSAAITLLHLCGPEMIPGAHLVSAASTRKQARECFEEAAMIVEADRKWRKPLRIIDHKNMIRFTEADLSDPAAKEQALREIVRLRAIEARLAKETRHAFAPITVKGE